MSILPRFVVVIVIELEFIAAEAGNANAKNESTIAPTIATATVEFAILFVIFLNFLN